MQAANFVVPYHDKQVSRLTSHRSCSLLIFSKRRIGQYVETLQGLQHSIEFHPHVPPTYQGQHTSCLSIFMLILTFMLVDIHVDLWRACCLLPTMELGGESVAEASFGKKRWYPVFLWAEVSHQANKYICKSTKQLTCHSLEGWLASSSLMLFRGIRSTKHCMGGALGQGGPQATTYVCLIGKTP